MTIRFDLDIDDMIAFQMHHLKKHGNIYVKVLSYMLLVVAVLFIIAGIVTLTGERDTTLALTCLTGGILIILSRIYKKKTNESYFRKLFGKPENNKFFGPVEITFDEKGVTSASQWEESSVVWNAVSRVEENESYFFIYQSGITALIIPKNKIAPAEVEELRSLLQKHVPARQEQKQN